MFFMVVLVSSSSIGNPKELPILPLPPYAPLPPSPLPLPLPPNSVFSPLKTPPPPSFAMVESPVEVERFVSLTGVFRSSSMAGSVDEVEGFSNGIVDLRSSRSPGSVKDGRLIGVEGVLGLDLDETSGVLEIKLLPLLLINLPLESLSL